MDFLPSFIETSTATLMPLWLIGFLALNIVGGWWLRSRALRIRTQDPDVAVWFNYQRQLGWLKTTSSIWVFVAISSVDIDWLGLLFKMDVSLYWQITEIALFVCAPPILTGLIHCILSHRVTQEVAQLDYSLSEVVITYVAARVGILLSFLFIALLPLAFAGHSFSFLAMVGVFIGLRICEKQTSKLEKNQKPYAVTKGELRDRIFALAKSTGVELKQFYVMPMARSRTVNAFALSNNTVMVTDYLLDRFTRAEVDAVLAHELGHLQLKHPQTMRWFVWIVSTLPVMLCVIFLSSPYLWIVFFSSLAVICISMCALLRRFEYAADAQAIVTTQDPRSLITGLVKVAKLSQMPLKWSRVSGYLMTHPSMQQRIEAIARVHHLSPAELNSLVASATVTSVQDTLSSERYAPERYAPETWQEDDRGDRIFSSTQKQKLNNRLVLCLLVCLSILPTILGQAVYWVPTPGLRWLGYLAATGVVVATYLAICNVVPVWGYDKLKAQLARRLEAEGFDLSAATFVGFSPESEPRIYEGCSNWDIGFLFLEENKLCYIGEQARFAISAQQITQVVAVTDTASLPRQASLSLTWQSKALAAQSIQFQMLESTSVRDTLQRARSLQIKVEEWQASQSKTAQPIAEQFKTLKVPNIGEVTSHPFSPFSLSASLFLLVILWVLSTAALLLTALFTISFPQSVGFIYLMPVVGIILQAVPSIRRSQQQRLHQKGGDGDTMMSQNYSNRQM